MKKILLLTMALLNAMLLSAQGVYQLWGTTKTDENLQQPGTIFKTDAKGNNLKTKYEFCSFIKNGIIPSKIIEYNGKYYGTTEGGGNYDGGVIFEWDPFTNVYTKKYDFGPFYNGSVPQDLVLSGGKFYGTTNYGGNWRGVIFEWDPVTNVYEVKYIFDETNGYYGCKSLKFYNGKFYGTTTNGGKYDRGVIFEWDPFTSIYTKKYDFGHDNRYGHGPELALSDGKFYGTINNGVNNGMGEIFEWDPATNIYTEKYDFDETNGYGPGNLALRDGKFYGTTGSGGNNYMGVIFEWDPVTNIYTKKYDFDEANGCNVYGDLILSGGKFYGTTGRGGIYGQGVIFEFDPSTGVYLKKYDLEGTNNLYPIFSPALSAGKFFGTSPSGGSNDEGVIFEWDLNLNIVTIKFEFENNPPINNGVSPLGSLTEKAGKLYGETFDGGNADHGVIFEWDLANNIYTKKYDFYTYLPYGNLEIYDGKFFGMMTGDGSDRGAGGGIFKWDPLTNNFEIVSGAGMGGSGAGSLTLKDGKFYGYYTITDLDGDIWYTHQYIIELDPSTNILKTRYEYNSPNGEYFVGKLTEKGGKFYGLTSKGYYNNYSPGIIFEWDPSTNLFIKKYDFDGTNGGNPGGSLVLRDGKFYGTTRSGGNKDQGVIFEWNPANNVYTKKYDFDGANGGNPGGSLMLSNGKFYGTTRSGGKNGKGVSFEWNSATNVFIKKYDFTTSPNDNLTLAHAPVANGLAGTCTNFPSVTIDASNNNQWVSITDEDNNAVAEIKANGNNLGVVTTSMFINNAAVREDGTKKLYLDRNITITPQVQPTTPVDIRLYIKATEYEALKNAVNSNGQSSGIDSINDVRIYKVEGGCSPAVSTLTHPVVTAAGTWVSDYVFSASITSFSSFYFAGKPVCTSPVITRVSTNPATLWPPNHQMKNVAVNYKIVADCTPVSTWLTVSGNEPVSVSAGDKSPDWIITDDHHVQLRAERNGAGNGRVYTITIHAADAAGNTSTQKTTVTVTHNANGAMAKGSIDVNGDYIDEELNCKVIPNPTNNYFNLQIESASDATIELSLLDISGRLITKWNTVNDKTIRLGEQLKPGIYILKVQQGQQQQTIKLVKL